MLKTILDLIKGLIAREPARLIGYGSTAAIAGAIALAKLAGVELDVDAQAAVGVLAATIITELIRRFVYSPATVEAIVAESN